MSQNQSKQDARFALIMRSLERAGQNPVDAGRVLQCRVISATYRDSRPGRFNIYVTPRGGWTHTKRDVARLSAQQPL